MTSERPTLFSLAQEVVKYRNYKGSINLLLGEELIKLRDQKQHRNRGYEDFYKYCKENFGLGRKMVNRLVKGTDVASLVQSNFGMLEIEGAPHPVIASEYQTRYLPEDLFANPNHFDQDETLLVDIWSSAVHLSKGVMPPPGSVRRASEIELKRRRRKNYGNEKISSPKTPKTPKSEHKNENENNNNNNVSTQEHYATEYDDGEFKYVASSPLKSPPLSQQYRSSQGEDPMITELWKTPPEKKSRCEFATLENISEGGEAAGTDLLEWMMKTFRIPQNQRSSYFRRLNVLLGQYEEHFTKVGVVKFADNKITSVWRLNQKKGERKRNLEESEEEEDEVPLVLKKPKTQSPPNSQQPRSQHASQDDNLPATPKIEKARAPRIHNDDFLNSQENNNNNREEEQRPSQKPIKRLGSGSQEKRDEQESSQKNSPAKRQNSSSQERKEDGGSSPSKRHLNSRSSSQEQKPSTDDVEELKKMVDQLQDKLKNVTNKNMELEGEVEKSSQKIHSAKKIINKMLESNRVSRRQQIIEELQPEGINDFRGQSDASNEPESES